MTAELYSGLHDSCVGEAQQPTHSLSADTNWAPWCADWGVCRGANSASASSSASSCAVRRNTALAAARTERCAGGGRRWRRATP
jgi:hypothetical protein